MPAEGASRGAVDARQSPLHPANLRKQVHLTLDPNFSVKSYIGAAATLLDKAQMADAQGQYAAAFVHYLTTARYVRASSRSVASFVTKHAEWAAIKQQRGATFVAYQELMNKTPEIVRRTHALEQELLAQAELEAREAAEGARPASAGDDGTRAAPGGRSAAPARPAPRGSEAATRGAGASGVPASCLAVETLWHWMYPGFEQATEHGRPVLHKKAGRRVLLLDVRPRAEHDAGHIRGADTVWVDPAALRLPPVAPDDIAPRSAEERGFWAQRHTYDVVVLYDAHTRTPPAPGGATPEQDALVVLSEMLARERLETEWLRGGFASWASQVGDAGVVAAAASPAAPRIPPRAPGHTLAPSRMPPAPPAVLHAPSRPPPAYRAPGMDDDGVPASLRSGAPSYPPPMVPSGGGAPLLARPPPARSPPARAGSVPLGVGAAAPSSSGSSGFAASAASFPTTRDVRVGLSGLKNFGNTCYMNATVQCLSATLLLAQYMLDGSYKAAINTQNPLGTRGAVAEAAATLLRALWSEQYAVVTPQAFRDAIGRHAPQFRNDDQQDSQEFLLFLLDGLHEDLNLITHKTPDLGEAQHAALERLPQQLASVAEWSLYRQRNNSVVVSVFQGQLRNQLTCLACQHTSTTYNAFMSLSLPVPTGRISSATLQRCLDLFVEDEVLDKANAWHCPQCKKARRASKRLSLARLPPVLILHLKRFTHRGRVAHKIETPVHAPTDGLDLSNYMPPPLPPGTSVHGIPASESQRPPYLYDLYAVTHHFGSLSRGHYTASVRSQGTWYYCDDTRVAPSDAHLQSAAPYVLFYRRRRAG